MRSWKRRYDVLVERDERDELVVLIYESSLFPQCPRSWGVDIPFSELPVGWLVGLWLCSYVVI